MRKRRIYLVVIGVAVLVGAIVVVVVRPEREPEYGGRKLSEWLESYEAGRSADPPASMQTNQATQAIRQIGPKSVPYLLEWIQWNPSVFKRKLERPINGLLNRFQSKWKMEADEERHQRWAIYGFQILGPEAKDAIGQLSRLLNQPERCPSGYAAGHALAFLGKDALAPLLAALTNQQACVRERVASSMEHLGTNARPAVPVLVKCLRDRDEFVAWWAPRILVRCKLEPDQLLAVLTNFLHDPGSNSPVNFIDALNSFPEEGRCAIPILVGCLKEPNEGVASHAARALGSFRNPLVIPVLKQSLEDPRASVRFSAARALGDFFQEGRSAVPDLLKLLGDVDAQVREDATNALRNIDPQALERGMR